MSKADFYKREGNRSKGEERAGIKMAKDNNLSPKVDRSPTHVKFYSTAAWQKSRARKLKDKPLCERCYAKGNLVPANIVHHRKPLEDGGEQLHQDNLMSICTEKCHRDEHAEIEVQRRKGELPW
jgi:5-methylcytosine-specific restriction endonuclease McrA